MQWSFLAAAVALAIGFMQLGAMSVWVSVLLLVLKAVLLAVIVACIAAVATILWRRYR
jgi:hypothetical protein